MRLRVVSILTIALVITVACAEGRNFRSKDDDTDAPKGDLPSDGGAGGMTNAPDKPLLLEDQVPQVGQTGVHRDATIELTFDGELDGESIDDGSLSVYDPLGRVAGTVSIDGAKLVFEPDLPWHLLGNYDVVLNPGITAEGGARELFERHEFQFRVVDGSWQTESLQDHTTSSPQPESNARGDFIALYRPTADSLSILHRLGGSIETSPIESVVDGFAANGVAINENGDGIAVWYSTTQRHWARFIDGEWQPTQSETATSEIFRVALMNDNTAVMTYSGSNTVLSRTLQPAGTAWGGEVTVLTPGGSWGMRNGGDTPTIVLQDEDDLVAKSYVPVSGWTSSTLIAVAPAANYVSYRSVLDSEDLVFTWWDQEVDEFWFARSRDGAWTSENYGAGTGATSLCVNSSDQRIGPVQRENGLFGVHWDGEAFVESDSLGLTGSDYSDYASCNIDRFGNGHAFTYVGGSLMWTRYSHGEGWSSLLAVADGVGIPAVEEPNGHLTITYNKSGELLVREFR